MIAIVAVILLSTGISFLCSLMEAALYSVPPSRVQSLIAQKVRGAELLGRLRDKIDIPISAILTFNTIANTIGGTVLGGLVGSHLGDAWILPMGAAFALVILVFSEIVPKTLGVTYADVVAPKGAFLIQGMIVILYPLVRMSQYVTSRIREAGAEQATVSKDDLIAQVTISAAEGALLPEEARLVRNALRLKERTAHELMTPRTVVYLLPAELPMSMVTSHSEHWIHSRLPLCANNNPDKIVGIVYRRDVFDALLTRSDEELATMKIGDLKQPVDFIPETITGNVLLERFLAGRQHFFIVTNEHGGMEGIVTLEDVLEELLGTEIVGHHDRHEDMQDYARKLGELKRQGKTGKSSEQQGTAG